MNLILGAALGLLGGGAFYCRAEARQQSSWGPSWKDMSSLQYLLFCRWYAARDQQPDHSHLSEARLDLWPILIPIIYFLVGLGDIT